MTTRIVLHNALLPIDQFDCSELSSPPAARHGKRQSNPQIATWSCTRSRVDPNYVSMDWKEKNPFRTIHGSSSRFSIPRIMSNKSSKHMTGRRSCGSILPNHPSFMEGSNEESYLSTVTPHVAMMYAKLDRLKRQKQEKLRLINLLEDMELNFLGPINSTYSPHQMETCVSQDYQLSPGHHETQLRRGDSVTIYGYLGCSRWRCAANKLSCQCDKDLSSKSDTTKSSDKPTKPVNNLRKASTESKELSKSTESVQSKPPAVWSSKSFDDIFNSKHEQTVSEVERLSYSSGCVYDGSDTTETQYKQSTASSDSAVSFTLNIEKSLYCKKCDRPMIPLIGSVPSSLLPLNTEQELLKEPSEDTFSLRSWSTLSTEFSPERLQEISCSESGRGSLYSEEDTQFTDTGYGEMFSFKRGGSSEFIYTVKKLTLGETSNDALTTHTHTLPSRNHGIELKSFSSERWGNFVFGVDIVKESPADKAGITAVIEIVAVNNEPVVSMSDITEVTKDSFTLTFIEGHAPMSLYSLLTTKARIGSAFDQLEVSLEDISDQESTLLKKYPSLQPGRTLSPWQFKFPTKIDESSENKE